jgi:hypothetical protein
MDHATPTDIRHFLITQKDVEFVHDIVSNSEYMRSFWTLDIQIQHYEYISGFDRTRARENTTITPPTSPTKNGNTQSYTITDESNLHVNMAVMFCCHPVIYSTKILDILLSRKYTVDDPTALILLLSKAPYDEHIEWVFKHARCIDMLLVLRVLVFEGSISTLRIAFEYMAAHERQHILARLVPLAVIRGSYDFVKLIGDQGGNFSDSRLLNSHYTPGVGGTKLLSYLVSKCGDISAIDKPVQVYISIMLPDLYVNTKTSF